MTNQLLNGYDIAYVEIYTPMVKTLAYWHEHALGFTVSAMAEGNNKVSCLLTSNRINIVLTSAYVTEKSSDNAEILSYIGRQYLGVRRIAFEVPSVKDAFEHSIGHGAIPTRFPSVTEDERGVVEEAAIKLYDHSEIVFMNRDRYNGIFKTGYKAVAGKNGRTRELFTAVDHIASEVRINDSGWWTQYLSKTIGTELVQSIESGPENKTGMRMKISQSPDKKLTLVISEPESYLGKSKVQQNIETFGPGIHHLAFSTTDLIETVGELEKRGVEFVNFPPAYYDLLRANPDFKDIDVDALQKLGILIDKEDDSFLYQKFIKPIGDRPFFLYEIVQRVNGYRGFALKNINVLKKAEEVEITRSH